MSDSAKSEDNPSMDFSHFWNPLGAKMERKIDIRVSDVVCVWSDLLGFGRPLKESGWQPDLESWTRIAERLSNAYQIHCRHTPSPGEFMLTLNDGVVRTRIVSDASNECLSLSLWLRAAIWAHLDVNRMERKCGFPGTRTVITGGQRAFYSFPEVRLDDLVINYTRKNPGLSQLAKETGNPLIICNPEPLQMNTAFSRAFILDEAGSGVGLKGSNVFVEQSLLDLVEKICATKSSHYRVTKQVNENDFLFAVEYLNPPEDRPWCFGLLLDRMPGEIVLDAFTTKVFRLKKFFPNDENPKDFCFDLETID